VNVYPFIEAEKVSTTGNVKRVCELLEVSRAAYYAHRAGDVSRRARDDAELTERIVAIHAESNGTYGAPRVQAELVAAGWRCSRKRVARLMRTTGLAGKTPKRWRTTTVPDPAATLPEDQIGSRGFACAATDLDSRWCGDITYIHTWEGWLYLATVIDLGSRRVVGWATADHLRTALVEQALRNAITQRQPEPGVIFHSDRLNPSNTHPASTPSSRGTARCGCRWGGKDRAGTTRSLSRSSPPSRPSCSTGNRGRRKPWHTRRSLNTSKGGTTPAVGIPASATSAQPPTKRPRKLLPGLR
jgi:transposase InsO family protein